MQHCSLQGNEDLMSKIPCSADNSWIMSPTSDKTPSFIGSKVAWRTSPSLSFYSPAEIEGKIKRDREEAEEQEKKIREVERQQMERIVALEERLESLQREHLHDLAYRDALWAQELREVKDQCQSKVDSILDDYYIQKVAFNVFMESGLAPADGIFNKNMQYPLSNTERDTVVSNTANTGKDCSPGFSKNNHRMLKWRENSSQLIYKLMRACESVCSSPVEHKITTPTPSATCTTFSGFQLSRSFLDESRAGRGSGIDSPENPVPSGDRRNAMVLISESLLKEALSYAHCLLDEIDREERICDNHR